MLSPATLPGFKANYIEADGIQTHYLEGGAGTSLVLIHGGGAGADGWGNWHLCLNRYAQNFHVIVPDMPGFGKSAKPDPASYPYTQARRNAHLIGLIEALNLGPADLIGNSMGGAAALGAAMERPDLVRKLVLMGSAGLAIANPDPSYMKTLREYDYSLDGMRKVMRALCGSRYEPPEELVRYRDALMKEEPARKALKAILSSHLTYDRDAIAAVKTPTLVVGGKEDQVAVLARTYGYLELLENSWGFVVPHAGHWVMMEAPDEFVAVTTSFLREDLFRS